LTILAFPDLLSLVHSWSEPLAWDTENGDSSPC
jgi:hypothetical protein